MSYAILRTVKLNNWGSISSSISHTNRVGDFAPNADPARRKLNKILVGSPDTILSDLKNRVSEITPKPRTNAVLTVELMLTTSPDWMIGKTNKELNSWIKSNIEFLKNKFGEKNVVSVTLHRDETTPHLAVYIVPEVAGKLNARAILGGRTNMENLQTEYADAMKKHGLERGIKGSNAKHTDIRKFYAQVNRSANLAEKLIAELSEPTPPPSIPFLSSKNQRTATLAAWANQERVRTEKLAEQASQAILDASLSKEQNKQLREDNTMLSADVSDLRVKLSQAYEESGLSKEQITALRKADVTLVAQRLGFTGIINPKENAIDLVKRIGEFTYEQSIAWLNSEFGPLVTGAVVTASLQDHSPSRPLTKAENVISRAVSKQFDALGCDQFRLTIVPADPIKKPFLPGKVKGKEERFYTRQDIINIVPWLRTRNNTGDNIFITPMDFNAYYILVDDARKTAMDIEKIGLQPCLIQKTSWEKNQVVFKVPKDLDRDKIISFFNVLNKEWGDEKMTALRHPFRLAGFRNMKPQHEREGQKPFVEITLAVNRFCTACTAAIRKMMDRDSHKHTEAPVSPVSRSL